MKFHQLHNCLKFFLVFDKTSNSPNVQKYKSNKMAVSQFYEVIIFFYIFQLK